MGTIATLVLWGVLADRIGERVVLAVGLGACGALLALAAYAPDFRSLVLLLALAGAAGASVNSASGRAVMQWFDASERGLALGVRQTAIPLGGLVAAVALPSIEAAGGLEAAFLFLAALCLGCALAGAAVIRARPESAPEAEPLRRTLRDRRLWRLCLGSGLFLVAQIALIGFTVLFLHDARGFTERSAGLVLAAAQVHAVALRIGIGRWSDLLGTRTLPLRRVGIAIAAGLGALAALLGAPAALLVAALVVAGGLSMAWNGLSFTAAAELAGPGRSGAAIGLQQSVLSAVGIGVPIAFAAAVAATSWRVAFALVAFFPLLGALVLRRLEV